MDRKLGLTLVEVVVSIVIFALVIVGLSSVFVAGGKLIMHNRERMTSAQLAKLFIDSLQKDVRQDTWLSGVASNGLTLGSTFCDNNIGTTSNINCPGTDPGDRGLNINNRYFSASYVIEDASTTNTALIGTDLRSVISTISWTEPSS